MLLAKGETGTSDCFVRRKNGVLQNIVGTGFHRHDLSRFRQAGQQRTKDFTPAKLADQF